MGVKRVRTPHYITGIGDGQVNVALPPPDSNNKQLVRRRDAPRISAQQHPAFSSSTNKRWSIDDTNMDDMVPEEGPWQFSAFALLISVVLLSALFLHVISDAQKAHRAASARSRLSPRKKKKTDEWNDDVSLKSDSMQDDERPLYFHNYHANTPGAGLQQHRHRKNSAASGATSYAQQQQQQGTPYQKNYYLNQAGSAVTPTLVRTTVREGGSSSEHSPRPPPIEEVTAKNPIPTPTVNRGSMHARVLSGASSFDSASLGGGSSSLTTPPRRDAPEASPTNHYLSRSLHGGSSHHQRQYNNKSLLLSPGTDDIVKPTKKMDWTEQTPRVSNLRPVISSLHEPQHHLAAPPDLTLPNLPLPPPPPDLQHSSTFETISGQSETYKFASPPPIIPEDGGDDESIPFMPSLTDGRFKHNLHKPPPSIAVDDLHLYQLMESGNVSRWEAAAQQQQLLDDESQRLKQQMAESFSESIDEIPSNDPRKSIHHKRPDLTISTDASSSLQGAIDFSELRLVEVIGGGGFGQVWKCYWRGTPVAVKVLTGSAQSKNVPKAVLEEFVAEINLLKGMRHPNICLYMGACLDPPNRAIITELAANGSLWDALRLPLMPPYQPCDGASRDGWPMTLYSPDSRHGVPPGSGGPKLPPIMPRGTWPWDLVKRVACGAARGMAYLHSGRPPVLHRDLKSANILLDESYTAKVCDFGLSRLKAQGRSMTGNCGTVQWMAPEVLANMDYNEKADVYSYGIICWELLTRQCPFDGMTAIQCALAVLNRNQRPEIPKWCPPSLHALIRACVKKNPDERPTFEQILLALDAMP